MPSKLEQLQQRYRRQLLQEKEERLVQIHTQSQQRALNKVAARSALPTTIHHHSPLKKGSPGVDRARPLPPLRISPLQAASRREARPTPTDNESNSESDSPADKESVPRTSPPKPAEGESPVRFSPPRPVDKESVLRTSPPRPAEGESPVRFSPPRPVDKESVPRPSPPKPAEGESPVRFSPPRPLDKEPVPRPKPPKPAEAESPVRPRPTDKESQLRPSPPRSASRQSPVGRPSPPRPLENKSPSRAADAENVARLKQAELQRLRNKRRDGTSARSLSSTPTRAPPDKAPPQGSREAVIPRKPPGPGQEQCRVCGRNFNADRIEKHASICAKAAKKKVKVFDVTKMRVKGTEAEQFIRKGPAPQPPAKPKADWRKQHTQFIEAIRQAKLVQRHLAKGGKASDLPPPPPSDTSDYVPCPHCGRKFSRGAADRHIPKCKTIVSNKKPPARRK